MMKILCLSLAGALVVSGAAMADDMTAFYGNTLHETRANGTQMWMNYSPDGTFHATSSDGRNMSGKYTYDAATKMNCLVMPPRPAGAPPAGPPPGAGGAAAPARRGPPCAPLEKSTVGASWDRTGPTGMKEHYVIEQGMTAPAAPAK